MTQRNKAPRRRHARTAAAIEPWLPYSIYANVSGIATTVLVVVCLAGLMVGGALRIPGFVALALAITVGIIWIVFIWLSHSHLKKAAALLSERAWVRWRYEEVIWQGYLDEREIRGRLFALISIGVMAGVGLLTGVLLDSEEMRIADSTMATVLVPALVGAAGAGVVALIVLSVGAGVTRRLRRLPGVFVISPAGFYITGVYWPFDSVGASLSEVERKRNRLVFEFLSYYKEHSNYQKVRVPIPPGREAVADKIVAKLSEKL